MFEHRPGVYAIKCSGNGCEYVGSSKDAAQRLWDHQSRLRRGVHPNAKIQRSWNKYGPESFTYRLLEYVNGDVVQLVNREQYYIDTLKPGFNIRVTAENQRDYKHRPESIQKMREVHANVSEEIRLRMSVAKKGIVPTKATQAATNANTGKRRSQDVKDKISASKKGKPVKNQAAASKAGADKMRNKPRSEETSRKIAETVARKKALGLTKHSPETIAKIRESRQRKR